MRWQSLLMASVVGFCAIDCSVSEAAAPKVEMALTSSKVYVGEDPSLKITVSAPPDMPVDIVREDLLLRRGCIFFELTGPDGKKRRGPPFRVAPIPFSAKDLQRVEAGRSLTLQVPVLCSPQVPGQCKLTVYYYPLPSREPVEKATLDLECIAISPKSVVERSLIKDSVPGVPGVSIELLSVEGELLYRRHEKWEGGEIWFLSRVLKLDPASKIISQVHSISKDQFEIWVSYSRENRIHIARLDSGTGTILDNQPVSAFFKSSEKK